MPAERRPKNLRDVSHLFLSHGVKPGLDAPRTAGAHIWLVAQRGLVNRAHFAAGCSFALAAKGLAVTLLEFDRGLPNIGYYFGVDASRYLRPVLDDAVIVSGSIEPGIEFVCCRRPESLHGFSAVRGDSDSPNIVLAAFELSGAASDSDHIDAVQQQCSRIAGREGGPDAVVVVADAEAVQPIIELVGDRSSGELIFHVLCGTESGRHSGASETYPLPDGIRSSWSARAAPEDPFFDGLVSNVLQVISHRRKDL